MSFKTKSIEVLLDLEGELRQSVGEEDNTLNKIITVNEELYKQILRDKSNEYALSLPKIKKDLIFYLVRYGTYLKTQYRKNDQAAETSLKKALKLDREIPIAHYRLGFLYYKKKSYLMAINHFQQATRHHETYSKSEYRLTNQQLYNAQLYLTNSALYIAGKAQKELEKIELEVEPESAPKLEKSSLYDMIKQGEDYLVENAFTILTPEKTFRCSLKKCEEIFTDESIQNTLILYFSDREDIIINNGRDKNLKVNEAEMLRCFLLKTSADSKAKKDDFSEIMTVNKRSGEILNNTFVQRVNRLKEIVAEIGVPDSIIHNDNNSTQGPRYYYTHSIPYIIMHRTDNRFILNE